MKMKIFMAGAVAMVTIAIIALVAHRQAQLGQENNALRQENETLCQENETLRQQARQAQDTAASRVRPEVDANELERLRQGQRELLRLRSEVGQLRSERQAASRAEEEGTVLKSEARLDTPETYRPPVEITVVAKTDSNNLRLAYAADQIIFNWELDESQLRVDGGPANGLHKAGAGRIPAGQYVTIRWVVTPTRQAISVDGELRFEHQGDYSQINRSVSVFPAQGSTVTVRSIHVKPLPAAAQ